MNPKKTENIIFSCKLVKPLHPTLILNNEPIKTVSQHDHLGVTLTLKSFVASTGFKDPSKSFKETKHVKTLKIEIAKENTRNFIQITFSFVFRIC